LGDIGYFGSVILYLLAALHLSWAVGAKFSLRNLSGKLAAVLIPLVILVAGYWLFLKGYEFDLSNPVKVFLDFGYPLGEAIYISLGILTFILSRKFLGGLMRPKVLFVLFALLIQFIADYTFLYQSSKETWYAGGLNDYIYLVAYFLMSLALFNLGTAYNEVRDGKQT
jgi:uncharacterized membrane protein